MSTPFPEHGARGPGGASRQATALRGERVTVTTGHLGEFVVDLAMFGWFPNSLPSEEVETETAYGGGQGDT